MFAVIFEVEPKPGHWDDYLTIAARLKPELERIEGFLANERFRSLEREGLLLSFSTWRDEKALVRWRAHALHHQAQARGRQQVFADYHLRVGEILADSGGEIGTIRPALPGEETEVGRGKVVTLTETTPAEGALVTLAGMTDELGLAGASLPAGLIQAVRFESITTPGKGLLLATWAVAEAASAWWTAVGHEATRRLGDRGRLRHRLIRILRDYGLYDRREAPQYHAPVGRPGSEA